MLGDAICSDAFSTGQRTLDERYNRTSSALWHSGYETWVEHIAAGVHHPRICWLFGDKMEPAILGLDHPEGYSVGVLSNANTRNVISLQMESQHVRDIQVGDQIAIHY